MRAQQAKRYIFLDVVKGIGIIEYIIWHIFIKFYPPPVETVISFRLVFSVTGFFVFGSGFLLGSYYYQKIDNNWLAILKRLCIRAGKLVLIMFVAGILMNFLYSRDLIASSRDAISSILTLFYLDSWDVPFQVLLAISLTLVFGFLVLLASVRRPYVQMLLAIVVIVIVTSNFTWIELYPYLWRYFFQGLVGVYVGALFYDQVLSNKHSNVKLLVMGSVGLSLFVLIEIFVTTSLNFYRFFLFNIAGITISVIIFFVGFAILTYLAYDLKQMPTFLVIKSLSLMGRYSLFVYILQILIIDIVAIVFEMKLANQLEGLIASFLLIIICVLACNLLEKLLKYPRIKSLYALIFQ
ncbi:MAG: acyltransferase family protein [Chloroflexota bacterium]